MISLKPHPNFNQTLLTGHTQGHTRAQLAACGLSRLHVGRTWAVCGPHMDSCTRTTLGPHMAHTQAVHAAFLSWALPGSLGSILGHCSAICYSFGLFTLDSDKNKIWQRIWQLLSSDWLRDLFCQSQNFSEMVQVAP